MNGARRVTVSAATFVLICFFLPWVQLSCLGLRDSASGFDLARGGDGLLWLIPLFMLAVILCGLTRFIWERAAAIFALAGTVGGSISAYLMWREYASTNRPSSLIAAQWTAWFWLGVVASLVVAVAAFTFYARRSRSP